MGLFTRIQNFFSQNKINFLYILSFITVFFMLGDNAWASNEQTSSISNEVLGFINAFVAVMGGFLALLTLFSQIFLDPSWVSGSFLGLDIQLKTMWIMMSNLVYFIFALLFVGIALMNIIGHDGDNYKLKQAIPKFIVGILIVPFSWFFVQFIVSVSSILTVAVLSLPYNDFKDAGISDKKVSVCESGYKVNMYATGSSIVTCSKGEKFQQVTIDKWLEDKKNIFGIMTIYTYSVMKVDEQGQVFANELASVKTLTDLALKLIVDLIFLFAFFLLMIALILALVVRGFYVWIYMMFSPVFGLLYFFGKGSEGMGEGSSKNFNLKEFIALAMVPVYVSAALVFGFIFLSAASKGMGVANSNFKIEQNGNSVTVGNVTVEGKNLKTSGSDTQGKLFDEMAGSLGSFFLQMMGIVILWMAVMAALRQSEITKSVVEPIAQFGGSVGELIKSAPKYAPIIPAPGGGMMSSKGLEKIGGTIASIPDIRTNNQVAGINQKIQNLFGGKTVPVEIMNDFKNKTLNGIERMDEFNTLRSQYLSMVEQYGHNDTNVMKLRQTLVDALKSSNLGGDVANYAKNEMQVANLNSLTTELTDDNTNKMLTGTLVAQKLSSFKESKVAGAIKASDYGFSSATAEGATTPSATTATTNQTINITLGSANQPVILDANNKITDINGLAQAFKNNNVIDEEVIKGKFTNNSGRLPANIQELINEITRLNNSSNESQP